MDKRQRRKAVMTRLNELIDQLEGEDSDFHSVYFSFYCDGDLVLEEVWSRMELGDEKTS